MNAFFRPPIRKAFVNRDFNALLLAISNEIAIDQEFLYRINHEDIGYIPVRPIKTIKYLDKISFNKSIYTIISISFTFLCIPYFGYQLIRTLKNKLVRQQKNIINKNKVILIANSRILPLFSKIDSLTQAYKININQPGNNFDCHITTFLNKKDIIKIYFTAIYFVFCLTIRVRQSSNILQFYVTFQWLVVISGLKRANLTNREVYFANHYDRWAVAFDAVLQCKDRHLIQHGLLPKSLDIPYPLVNLGSIFIFDKESQHIFENIYQFKCHEYLQLGLTLELSKKMINNSILIIGQPHSMDREVELIHHLISQQGIETILIRPHPLYPATGYKSLQSDKVLLIDDNNYFPRVSIALSYESTLGLEYEKAGIHVIWWKSLSIDQVIRHIHDLL